MTKVDTLEVVVQANARQFENEMARVQDVLKSLNTTTGNLSTSVGKNLNFSMIRANITAQALLGTVRLLFRSFTGLLKQVFELGSLYSRLKITTDIVAGNIGMTADEVERLRYELGEANTYGERAETVIRTLAMSGIIQLAEGLKAVDYRTGETVEGVTALVLAMKDLGGSAALESEEAIRRLSKFIRTGSQEYAEGMIKIGYISRYYQEYADSIGVAVDQLTNQQRATVNLNIVMEEARKAQGAYAATMQTSGKLMQSIAAIWRNILEILGGYLEPVFSALTQGVFTLLKGIRESLFTNAQAVKAWAMRVSAWVIAVIRVIGMLLSNLPFVGKAFAALRDFRLKPITVGAEGAEEAIDGFAGGMDNATDSSKKLKKELSGLAAFDELTVLKKPAGTEAGGATGALTLPDGSAGGAFFDAEEFNANIEEINGMADEFFGRFEKKIQEFREKIQPIMDFLNPIFEFFKKYWLQILIVVGVITIFIGVLLVAAAIIGAVTTVVGFLATAIAGVPIWAIVLAIIGLIAQLAILYVWWKWTWEMFGDTITNVWEKIKRKIYEIYYRYIKPVFDQIGYVINTLVIPVFKNLWAVTKWVFGLIRDWINQKWWEIKTKIIEPVVNWIMTNVVSKFMLFYEKLKGIFNAIMFAVLPIWNVIKEAFRSGINWLITKINSFITTINNMITTLNRAGSGVPGWTNVGFRVGYIPYLAQGGVVESPTLAVLGEAGREAVVPLENSSWLDELAEKINTSGGQHLVVKIGDDTIFDKAIDYMNDTAMRKGTNIITI